MTANPARRLSVSTINAYVYDSERVEALWEQLQPDPNMYGDDHAYAVFIYLDGSAFGSDVFEDQGNYDQWPDSDAEYDPNA